MAPEAQWGKLELGERSAELNASYPVDKKLWPYELRAAEAWAEELGRLGVLSEEELAELKAKLGSLPPEAPEGDFEDVHAALEHFLGPKIHTARSRNELVVLDELLWWKGAAADCLARLRALLVELVELGERSLEVVIPGLTHSQPAQPVPAAHLALAHFWALIREAKALNGLLEAYASRCPLGSGALAGSFLPVDRFRLAERLGFEAPSENSLDSVSSRDYALAALFWAASVGAKLSRLGADWVWGLAGGWLKLGLRSTTGSSLMPHKRNPDVAELLRGGAAKLLGNLTAGFSTVIGAESGYQKDFQYLKSYLFDSYGWLLTALGAAREMVSETQFAQIELPPELGSTSAVKALVSGGVPFREAYFKVKEGKVPLAEPDPGDFPTFGGAAPERVKEALELAKKALEAL